jgi:YqaJ-like viral recombinase domain
MMEIFNHEQGSPEWFRVRLGIPTASEFKTIIGVRKDAREKVTRDTYMRKLAGEILTGEPMESYSNEHMERGKLMEEEAREFYCFAHSVEPQRVGFIRNGSKGCSPDSLIGERRVLEIKTALPHILIGHLLKREFPPEHKAQCQGALWVTERDEIDIAIYWPKLRMFEARATRDEDYIQNLSDEVDRFNEELARMVERVRAYGHQQAA